MEIPHFNEKPKLLRVPCGICSSIKWIIALICPLISGNVIGQVGQFEVNNPAFVSWEYSIGKDADDNIYVVWGDERHSELGYNEGSGSVLYVQKYNSLLNPVGDNRRATEMMPDANSRLGQILVWPDGRHIIAYGEYRSPEQGSLSHRSIWIKGFYADGELWFDKQKVAESDDFRIVLQPKIVKLSDSTFAVYWQDIIRNGGGPFYFYAQRYALSIEKIGDNFQINPEDVQCHRMDIHYVDEGVILVQYANIYNWMVLGMPFSLIQYHAADLAPAGEPLSVPGNGFVTPLGLDSLFISYTKDDGAENYYQFLNPDMSERTPPVRVNDDETVNPKGDPNIILNPAGGFLLVWEDYRNGVPGRLRFSIADIYGQLYDAGHRPIGPNIKLNHEPREVHQYMLRVLGQDSHSLIFFWQASGLSCIEPLDGDFAIGADPNRGTVIIGSRLDFDNLVSGPVWGWRNAATACQRYLETPDYQWVANYPNPFNAFTSLIVDVNPLRTKPLHIDIYDIMGRIVDSVSDTGLRNEGIHEIPWNAYNLASGIYLAKIRGSSQTLKLMLMK